MVLGSVEHVQMYRFDRAAFADQANNEVSQSDKTGLRPGCSAYCKFGNFSRSFYFRETARNDEITLTSRQMLVIISKT